MNPILICNNLVKRYSYQQALGGVNLTLERGRIIGLLGPNGSGKTTLIKLASGLLVPTGGEILVGGMAPGVETKKIVSYLPERTYLNTWMRVSDLLNFFEDFYKDFDKVKAYEMLQRLNINPADRLKNMSKGTKEKVQLILVMSRAGPALPAGSAYRRRRPGGERLYFGYHHQQLYGKRHGGDLHSSDRRH